MISGRELRLQLLSSTIPKGVEGILFRNQLSARVQNYLGLSRQVSLRSRTAVAYLRAA
jgi:hypothetical protein